MCMRLFTCFSVLFYNTGEFNGVALGFSWVSSSAFGG